MQLKKLEMHGFKSFATKTEIVFEPGVTGVVGPNGCGKSNVVDAIKWVLGTMSYKAVRGDEMMDVIFKGAPGASPTGFAEVSLTLDNTDKTLDIEFDEVVITRRLHRDGVSEYQLNRSAVRLKDIRNLLYGTGIGTDNYSIIEQGKIDRLVMSNPRERRLVFDEAAGVSRYRARRHETQLRLNKVTQDLLRMQDVIREVQRELRGVRIQAGRAQKFKLLEEEYKDKRLKLTLHENKAMRARMEEIKSRKAELDAEHGSHDTTLAGKRGELERLETELRDLDAEHANLKAKLVGFESKEHYLRKSVEEAAQRLTELDEAEARTRRDLDGHEAKLTEMESQERRFLEEAEEAGRIVARLDEELEEIASHVEQAQREVRLAEEELENKRAEAVELAHRESQHRSELARIENECTGIEGRIGRIRERSGKSSDEHADLLLKLFGIDDTIERAGRVTADLKEKKEIETRSLDKLKREKELLDAHTEDLRAARESRVARRETLTDLERQREGLDAGARKLLEEGEGVVGAVVDLVEVDTRFIPAVENALGNRVQYVIFKDDETAVRASEMVREESGRTGVISLESCTCDGRPEEVRYEGILGRASEFVRCADEHRSMVNALLDRVWIAEDAVHAKRLRQSGLVPGMLVTPDGECFESPGVTMVGRTGSSGLLSRRAELRRLESEIEETQTLLAEVEGKRDRNDVEVRECEERLEHIRQQVYEQMVERSDAIAQREQLEKRRLFLEDEILALNGEWTDLDQRRASFQDRIAELRHVLDGAADLRTQVEGEIVQQADKAKKYRESLGGLQEETTSKKILRGQEEEKASALQKRSVAITADVDYVRKGVESSREEIRETRARRETVSNERVRNVESIRSLTEEITALRGTVEGLDQRRTERSTRVDEVRSDIAGTERRLAEVETTLQNLRIEESEQRVREQNLIQRAREEYAIELDGGQLPLFEEEGVETDWGEIGEDVERLRRRIQTFGSVNVVALEQLKQLEEREKYLITQEADLQGSKTSLDELIKKLNKECRELFEKMLAEVRKHFYEIFRKLWGGGKADIIIDEQDGVDPMDQGLEILVKPPNKEVTTLRLLSGGERTLTAIALVMALFRCNPSPFCVLDEADAALDEKNVSKFAGLIREFSTETQFIVITHNQRTMACADVLYGVSMPNPGVSRRVKVDLSGDNLKVVRENQTGADNETAFELEAGPTTATAVLDKED